MSQNEQLYSLIWADESVAYTGYGETKSLIRGCKGLLTGCTKGVKY